MLKLNWMFALWTGLECAALNHLFLKVLVLILAGVETGAPGRVSKPCVLWCFLPWEWVNMSCKSGHGPFLFFISRCCHCSRIRSDKPIMFFLSLSYWEKGRGQSQWQKSLAGFISPGLSFFDRSMGGNVIIRPHRVAVKLVDVRV